MNQLGKKDLDQLSPGCISRAITKLEELPGWISCRLQAKTLFLRKTAKTPYPLHCLLELRLTFPKAKTATLYLLALIRSTCWDEDEKTARFSYGSFQGVTIPWSSIAGTSGPETIVGFRDRKEAFNFLSDYDPDHGPLEQTEMSEKPVTYRKP